MAAGAMYPGTFDPITNGHVDLVRRAAEVFDRVVVAVAHDTGKTPTFDLDERVELADSALSGIARVEVASYAGLTVDFAREHGLKMILRGLRAVSDFEFEFQLATMNRHLEEGVETVFLTPSEEFTYISSSLVRQVAALGGDVSAFVPPEVETALKRRFQT